MKKICPFIIAMLIVEACVPTTIQPELNDPEIVEQTQEQQDEDNSGSDEGNNTSAQGDTGQPDNESPMDNNEQDETDPLNSGEESQDANTQSGESENQQSLDEETPIAPIPVLCPIVDDETGSVQLSTIEAEYNEAANGFALKLLPKLYAGKSFVASPLSIQMALSMITAGAVDQTLQEMLDALGFSALGVDGMNGYSKSLIEQLPAADQSVSVQLANAMVARDDIPVKASYKEQMASYFYAPVVNMSFSNPGMVREAVNDWCSRNTNGIIPSILDKDCESSTLAYLLNALYLKASWTIPFDYRYQVSKGRPFYTADGSVNVDYLISQEQLRYVDMGSYHVAFRPLGDKAIFDMAIILPKENDGLDGLMSVAQEVNWTELQASVVNADIALKIPAFDISSSYDLVEHLLSLGVERAFSGMAQFDNIFEGVSAYISQVLHKARIILGDGGIEAASVTAITMEDTVNNENDDDSPKPIQFFADHPFVYIVAERSSGTILFEGVFDGQ